MYVVNLIDYVLSLEFSREGVRGWRWLVAF